MSRARTSYSGKRLNGRGDLYPKYYTVPNHDIYISMPRLSVTAQDLETVLLQTRNQLNMAAVSNKQVLTQGSRLKLGEHDQEGNLKKSKLPGGVPKDSSRYTESLVPDLA